MRVWALEADVFVEIAGSHLTRTFTAEECEAYAGYPCPAETESATDSIVSRATRSSNRAPSSIAT